MQDNKNNSTIKTITYKVRGIHCKACEVFLVNKLSQISGVETVIVSTRNSTVTLHYIGKKTPLATLNKILEKHGYFFTNQDIESPKKKNLINFKKYLTTLLVILPVVGIFFFINNTNIGGLIQVNATSSLPTFFLFGILASFSTCAALVGGIVVSLSEQWLALSEKQASTLEKLKPHFLFNLGRISSYSILGGMLGFFGQTLQAWLPLFSLVTLIISLYILILGLRLLGINTFSNLHFPVITSIATFLNNFHSKKKFTPFIIGFLTFFVPCGFTIITQGLALASSNPLQGALILLFFALGTTPILFMIGLSSIKFSKTSYTFNNFSAIAGILAIFFALYTFNAQLDALSLPSLSNFTMAVKKTIQSKPIELVPIVNGKQVVVMEAFSNKYVPNKFTVKAGIPVRWEIIDKGTSGCSNTILAKDLFEGVINLTPGTTAIKEFTPEKSGAYKFTCWMGMITGFFEVQNDSNTLQPTPSESPIPTEAKQLSEKNTTNFITCEKSTCSNQALSSKEPAL